MSTLRPSVVISWAGISDTPRSRLKMVTWHALATPSGISITVTVQYRGDSPGTSKDLEARYSARNAPSWVPRPPKGWMDSLNSLDGPWIFSKGVDLEMVEPE